MAGAGNLEEDLVLAFQLNFPVVEPPGEIHGAVKLDECFAIEALMLCCFQLGHFYARLNGHAVRLVLEWENFVPGIHYTGGPVGLHVGRPMGCEKTKVLARPNCPAAPL